MEKILIAFHGSDGAHGAVQHMADLAKRARPVDPFLLYVGRPIPMRLLEGTRSAVHRLETQLREAGEKLLGPAKEALARAGIDAPVQVEFGDDPGRVIVEHAKRHYCDMIVKGPHGRGGPGDLVVGSVADTVLHLAHIPVTFVR